MSRRLRTPGAFERHLLEAVELNRHRAPLYAQLTNGQSRAISRSLIRYERLLIPVARWFDRRAEPYHRAGVPLLEEAFVSMERTPEWLPYREPSSYRPRLRPRGGRIAREVRRAFRQRGFPGAAAALERHLGLLATEPSYHCMLRHLLESTLRITVLAPEHDRLARELGLRSPLGISSRLLRLHLCGCGSSVRLDARAAPLQARGIALIGQDVPPVPARGR
ncbi:MAG: hypothetical protein H0X65_12220 [Gemmatimonadetes bacterium]|nr:hypothetical protein [Gemmatimonadota bacterium]